MTGKERLRAALLGEPVDRAPIWLREGFETEVELPDSDDFLNGWKANSVYRETLEYVAPHIDCFSGWNCGHMNRFLMIPPEYISFEKPEIQDNCMIETGFIRSPRGDLPIETQCKYHNNNRWTTKYPVRSITDLRKVAEIPWKLDKELINRNVENGYPAALEKVGNRGIPLFGISSPIVVISGLMNLQLFLELSFIYRDYMHELLKEITRRIMDVLRAVFERDMTFDTAANLGGSEQVTPPMMAPEMFDEFVVPYDGQIVSFLKQHAIPVNVHCHGKVRYALSCFREMGVDATDPVEPPPSGDITFKEAQEIAEGKVTLAGNLEFNEFTYLDPLAIRERVREIFQNGNSRVVLGTSAGPNTDISQRVADNYRAFVDAGLEFGG